MSRHSFRLFVLIVIASLELCAAASVSHIHAQRRARASTSIHTTAIPSPSAILGFQPGDDRTMADWRQITDYFSAP
jgi:hypothetical protein